MPPSAVPSDFLRDSQKVPQKELVWKLSWTFSELLRKSQKQCPPVQYPVTFLEILRSPSERACLATRAAIYRSLRPLCARNHKKVSKRVFLGVWRQVLKNTRKSLKIPIFGPFCVFFGIFRLFRVFLRLFSRPPKGPFLRLFCDFGPRGPGDSCKWRLGSQSSSENPLNILWELLRRSQKQCAPVQYPSAFVMRRARQKARNPEIPC